MTTAAEDIVGALQKRLDDADLEYAHIWGEAIQLDGVYSLAELRIIVAVMEELSDQDITPGPPK